MGCAVAVCASLAAPVAQAEPHSRSTPEARQFRFPRGWLRQAFCIHRQETHGIPAGRAWRLRWVDWRGHPSRYAGGMQFLQSTWERAGGRGEPWEWPVREQVYRAFVIWKANGGSWHEWGTMRACGL